MIFKNKFSTTTKRLFTRIKRRKHKLKPKPLLKTTAINPVQSPIVIVTGLGACGLPQRPQYEWEPHMKILVLGATGRTGYLFTRKALEEGYAVTAYVRNPDKALSLLGAHQNLTIIPGTLDDAERLAAASSGQDVMVSILGQKATVREFLSSTFMQERLPLIMQAVTGAGVKHCVLMSAYGVGDTVRTASLPMRLVCKVIMRGIFTDKVKADALVAEYQPYISRAHPGRLTDKPGRGGVKVYDMAKVERTAGIPTIAREDVADALLTIAKNPQNAGTDFLVTIGNVVLRSPQK